MENRINGGNGNGGVDKSILAFLGLPKNDPSFNHEAKVRLKIIQDAISVLFDVLQPGATVEFKFRRGMIILAGQDTEGGLPEERLFVHRPGRFLEGAIQISPKKAGEPPKNEGGE